MTLAALIEIDRPAALWALAVVPLLWLMFRRGLVDAPLARRRLSLAARCMMVVLVTLALCEISGMHTHHRKHVVLLVDRSVSISDAARQQADEYVKAARSQRGDDLLSVIEFPEGDASAQKGTDFAAALRRAALHAEPAHVPEFVLLSDGNATRGDARAAAAGPVATVPLSAREDAEVQVAAVDVPAHVREGEAFYLDVTIATNRAQLAEVEVYRGPLRVADQTVTLQPGNNALRLRQQVRGVRVAQYTVRVSAAADTLLDNNAADALVYTAGRPRVLIVDSRPSDAEHLVRALAEQDIAAEVRPPAGMPADLSQLQNFELLILSNTPATALNFEQMDVAHAYVQDLGGGLIMIGGEQSFGLGGYHKTPIEQALPVSSDFDAQKQKPSLAIMLVIDKSGSMGGMKVELAKDAARSAIDLLEPRDRIGVIAFDGEPHWIARLQSAADAPSLARQVAALTAGGGTNLAPAMRAAAEALQATTAALKHMIILTDGHSAPGDFAAIARDAAAARITASTIGVGDGADRTLLASIAEVGGGRHYFTNDPRSIPQIFARETIEAARGAIQEQPFRPQVLRADPTIDGIDFNTAPYLLGYVSTRAKPTAELLLMTERSEPLLAWWRYGLGMAAAFTSDAKPRWAAEWIGWPGYGRFWSQLARRIMRPTDGRGLLMQVAHDDGELHVTLDAVDTNSALLDDREIALTIITPNGARRQMAAKQTAPGRYEASIDAGERGAYHIEAVDRAHGRTRARAARGVVVGYPPELRIAPTNETFLRELAEATGGMYNPAPAKLFAPTSRTARTPVPLRPYLLAAAIVLFVFDVALRRIDLSYNDDDARD